MITLFTILHVIVCLFLVIVVLLQSGKAADLAGAFGGMGSQTAFGPRGAATVLSKATTISAILFMVTSLSLSVLHTREGGGSSGPSVLDKAPAAATQPATPKGAAPAIPVTPAPAAPTGPIKMELQDESGKTVSTQELPLPERPKQTPAAPKK